MNGYLEVTPALVEALQHAVESQEIFIDSNASMKRNKRVMLIDGADVLKKETATLQRFQALLVLAKAGMRLNSSSTVSSIR